MNPETDVVSAQSFDAGAFFNNLVNVGATLATARISPTQSNGQPSTTQTPNLTAGAGGSVLPGSIGGVSPMVLLLGAAAVVGLVVLLRK